jgi:hypothetical protein
LGIGIVGVVDVVVLDERRGNADVNASA